MKKSIGAKTVGTATPAWVIGSYDEQDKPNLMMAAWGGICSSDPPCVTVSLRKARQTYDNIVRHGAFTVCIPSATHLKESDYVGIVSGKNVDKFSECGLTVVPGELVHAPYVAEFPIVIECKLIKMVELGVHTQFIGEIVDVKAEESLLGDNGMPDMLKMGAFVYDPGQSAYLAVGEQIGKAFSVGKR